MRQNTSGRAFWVIWCLGWAGLWLVLAVGAAEAHSAWIIPGLLAAGSAAAVAAPVGRTRAQPKGPSNGT